MTDRRTLFAGLLLLSIATACVYASGMAAASQNDGPSEVVFIQFGTPVHDIFFKYQKYLADHRQGGETPETWNSLPPEKQKEKLAAGEAMLKALHRQLLAKPQLSVAEASLLQAVWGMDNPAAAVGVTVSEETAADAKPVSNEKVEAILNGVESSKKVGGWEKLFDGGGSRSDVNLPAYAASGSANHQLSIKEVIVPAQPLPHNVPPAPFSEGNKGGAGGNALPIAAGAGAVLLAGASFGAWTLRKKFSGNNSSLGNMQGGSNLTNGCRPLNFTSGEVLTLETAKTQSEFEALPGLKGCNPFGFACPTKGNDPTCGTKGNGPCKCFMGDLDCPEHCSVNIICSCKGPVGYIPQDQCHPYTNCPGNTNCRPVAS